LSLCRLLMFGGSSYNDR